MGAATLALSNEVLDNFMKITTFLEKSSLLIKSVNERIKMKKKEEKGRFFVMLLGALGTSLLENLWTATGSEN